MTRTRDFGNGPDLSKIEPLDFTLHGEKFDCVLAIQGNTLINLIKDAQSDDVDTAAEVSAKFFEAVLTPESHERFLALINSKDKIVEVDTLGEIVGWLVEEYTNRPEAPRED